jgi:hypothetical protein
MWEKVSSRAHKPLKVYPYGPDSDELMLFGTVNYGLKTGEASNKDWAARAHLVKEDGTVKLNFYQVFLVRPLRITSRGLKLTFTRIPEFSSSRPILCNYYAVYRGYARGRLNAHVIVCVLHGHYSSQPLQG